ncbi:MAG: hypothetical protein Q7V43_07375 [Myxococcales bacterium]|nr:hypothetical protein [Myxococcales bacterium]
MGLHEPPRGRVDGGVVLALGETVEARAEAPAHNLPGVGQGQDERRLGGIWNRV